MDVKHLDFLLTGKMTELRSIVVKVAVDVYNNPLSLHPYPHHPPPFSPSLVSLMVSVDVKYHVYSSR